MAMITDLRPCLMMMKVGKVMTTKHSLSWVRVSTMADLFWLTGCIEVTLFVEK